ncbi:MAG TPA: hypothetical protein VFQ50_02940 [Flavobacterium sp.]|jgi:hypothetical protein|nr:hypothetical protein [Flavobacterium sp.]
MIFKKYAKHDTLTFIFKIPHISNLFIYKDNWDNNIVMRKVIVELLDIGQFETLFLGNHPASDFLADVQSCEDCAFIALSIHDLSTVDTAASTATSLFIRELQNRKNRFLFESNIVDEQKNVTAISLSIKVQSTRRAEVPSSFAA